MSIWKVTKVWHVRAINIDDAKIKIKDKTPDQVNYRKITDKELEDVYMDCEVKIARAKELVLKSHS